MGEENQTSKDDEPGDEPLVKAQQPEASGAETPPPMLAGAEKKKVLRSGASWWPLFGSTATANGPFVPSSESLDPSPDATSVEPPPPSPPASATEQPPKHDKAGSHARVLSKKSSWLPFQMRSSAAPISGNSERTKEGAVANTESPEVQEESTVPSEPKSPPNPLVKTMPQSKSFWNYFFSRYQSLPGISRKLINNGGGSYDEKACSEGKQVGEAGTDEQNRGTEGKQVEASDGAVESALAAHTLSKEEKVVGRPGSLSSKTNHILPDVGGEELVSICQGGFHSESRMSIVQSAWNSISAIMSYTKLNEVPLQGTEHLLKTPYTDIRLRAVVVIGIHGWFPTKIVQRVIGEPTGTSLKFCQFMSNAVRSYLEEKHRITLQDEAITCIPLEGEGKVEDRVAKLYNILLSSKENTHWKPALHNADVIFVATHSQGTPVSVMLLDRLMAEGHIAPDRQRIGILAMAGVSHGPFPFLKQNLIVRYLEADPARELFEFMDQQSDISVKYQRSLERILTAGAKLIPVASMADQVVPLYSAIMHGYDHPSIYRAIYIDGVDYTDDFLTHLLVYILKLRNHRVFDHGLVIYLSEPIAGSLYSGTPGHSTIYEEQNVYKLAAKWTLETPTVLPTSVLSNIKQSLTPAKGPWGSRYRFQVIPFESSTTKPLNPFYIPWIMRGILEDEKIRKNKFLDNDLCKLLAAYKDWNPTTRVTRELKLRFEPIQSHL